MHGEYPFMVGLLPAPIFRPTYTWPNDAPPGETGALSQLVFLNELDDRSAPHPNASQGSGLFDLNLAVVLALPRDASPEDVCPHDPPVHSDMSKVIHYGRDGWEDYCVWQLTSTSMQADRLSAGELVQEDWELFPASTPLAEDAVPYLWESGLQVIWARDRAADEWYSPLALSLADGDIVDFGLRAPYKP